MKFSSTRFMARKYREEATGEGEDAGSGGDDANTVPAQEYDALKAKLNEISEQNERLNHKIGEANKHKREFERLAKEKEREKAEAEGNYEQLHKSAMEELEKERSEHVELKTKIQKRDVKAQAMKIALAMNPLNDVAADDLAEHVAKRLKYTDEGIKVTDKSGNLTVSTLEDLKKEIEVSDRYSFYIKGNQSSGGSASGGDNSGSGTAKTMTRAEFDGLNHSQRANFLKNKGKVTD